MPSGQQADVVSARIKPLGHEQITGGFGAAQTLPNIPDNAELALIQVEGGGIRWRDDGTAPTGSNGFFISGANSTNQPREVLNYNVVPLSAFQLIQDATQGAPTAVQIAYYRYV